MPTPYTPPNTFTQSFTAFVLLNLMNYYLRLVRPLFKSAGPYNPEGQAPLHLSLIHWTLQLYMNKWTRVDTKVHLLNLLLPKLYAIFIIKYFRFPNMCMLVQWMLTITSDLQMSFRKRTLPNFYRPQQLLPWSYSSSTLQKCNHSEFSINQCLAFLYTFTI